MKGSPKAPLLTKNSVRLPRRGLEDSKIDPYGTYRYRVTAAGGKPSNEVIVGPPPFGVLVLATAPATGEPGVYGTNTALSRDQNGDPAVAFVWSDPNGDGNQSDAEVDFVRWIRARHEWMKPVKVATSGDMPSKNVEPVSIACDPADGTLAISMPIADSGVSVAFSRDGGQSWDVVPVERTEGPAASTSVVLNAGTI